MSLGLVPFDITFQFTLPRGERRASESVKPLRLTFQFTLPRGERLTPSGSLQSSPCFNSRSREGSDLCGQGQRDSRRVSIHAPARGATYPA